MEAIGTAILLTITIAREVSGIVTVIVESVLLGLISLIAIVEGVSVLVMVRSVIVVMRKANFTWVLVAIVTMTVTTPRDGILFGLSFFTNSILLLLFIFGIVIEGRMAFEVGMAVEVVMAWADARSVTVLMIVESIFLRSRIIIEGRMAVVVMGWSEVVMRTAWISRIVFAIITMMFIEGSCS